ncbi:MAG: hypothetical protein ACKVVT_12760 [Dehalococcoidia bacterium]
MLTTLATIVFDVFIIGAAALTTAGMVREVRASRIPAVGARAAVKDRRGCATPRPAVARQRAAHQRRSALRLPAA